MSVALFVAGSMSLVLRQHACNDEYHLIPYDSASSFPRSDVDLTTAYLFHGTSGRHSLQTRLIFVTGVWGGCPI